MKWLFSILLLVNAFAEGQVTSFKLKDAVTGKDVSLSDYKSEKGIVVITTSNSCPYDQYYADRIRALNDVGIRVILVNAKAGIDENADAMKKKAIASGWNFPYLADKDQQLVKSLNASKTPEAFLLRRDKDQFLVIYSGAIDDNPQVGTDVNDAYLRNAIADFLAGHAIQNPQTRPVGCSLRTGQ